MNIPLSIILMIGYSSIVSLSPTEVALTQGLPDSSQAKRDLSLSYAATDIGSKEGTRIKTITVIKNVGGKKNQPLKIDSKLHKSENWGSHFRDNYDLYGAIPEVPDIDDLFEFVNTKEDIKPKEKNNPRKTDENDKKAGKEDTESKKEIVTTTLSPSVVEEVSYEPNDDKVEKITGDAELIQPGGKQGKVKSQSLDLGKYRVEEPKAFDSKPQSSFQQHFSNSASIANKNDKYIQSPLVPYNYLLPGRPSISSPKPLPLDLNYLPQTQVGRGTISVTTPSGKKYDIPFENITDNPPYLAPNFRINYSSPLGPKIATSSQRPYIAPNVRKSYEVQLNNTSTVTNRNCVPNASTNGNQPLNNVYRNIPESFRTISYKPNLPRSRGLRY